MRSKHAFTLTEIVIVLTVGGVLLLLAITRINTAERQARRAQCLENLRGLQFAAISFADDHEGLMPKSDGHFHKTDWHANAGSWVTGNALSSATLDSLVQGTLYSYIVDPEPYRCPSDRSRITGRSQLRLRSYSLNTRVSVEYPAGHPPMRKISAIPHPTQTLSFVDEAEKSINDAAFAVLTPGALQWIDYPTDRHDRGGNFAFIDGHAEYWRWLVPKVFPHEPRSPTSQAGATDLRRVQDAAWGMQKPAILQ